MVGTGEDRCDRWPWKGLVLGPFGRHDDRWLSGGTP